MFTALVQNQLEDTARIRGITKVMQCWCISPMGSCNGNNQRVSNC
jgi:hypothetical protein